MNYTDGAMQKVISQKLWTLLYVASKDSEYVKIY